MRKDNLSPGGLGFIPFALGLATRRSQICSEWRNIDAGARCIGMGRETIPADQNSLLLKRPVGYAGVKVPGLATVNIPLAIREIPMGWGQWESPFPAQICGADGNSGDPNEPPFRVRFSDSPTSDNNPPTQETLDKSIPSIFRKRSWGLKISGGVGQDEKMVSCRLVVGLPIHPRKRQLPTTQNIISLSPPPSETFRCLTRLPERINGQ